MVKMSIPVVNEDRKTANTAPRYHLCLFASSPTLYNSNGSGFSWLSTLDKSDVLLIAWKVLGAL